MSKLKRIIYRTKDDRLLIAFEEGLSFVDLDELLPDGVQARTASPSTLENYLNLANTVLATPEAWADYCSRAHKIKPGETTHVALPPIDVYYLHLKTPEGKTNLKGMIELFTVVQTYWKKSCDMVLEPGLVAVSWHKGMSAEEIIQFIRDNTQTDPKTGQPKLATPQASPTDPLVEALLPVGAWEMKATKVQMEKIPEWLSSVPLGHANYLIPQAKAADLLFLGLVDASGKVDKTVADAARDYIWEHIDLPPDYPNLWRHIQANRGRLPAEDSQADYSAYNLHLAELFDEGIDNLALVKAVLVLAETNVAVPTERLYRAARVIYELDQAKDSRRAMEKALDQQTLDLGGWLFLDKTTNFMRKAQKMVTSGASKIELEAYIETTLSKAGSTETIQIYLDHYQRPGYAKTLQEVGVINEQGVWSEVGFIRQKKMIAEAEQKGAPASLERLRWKLYRRYRAEEPVPFSWGLLSDRLPLKTVQRARLLASMALSGGMTGKKFQIDEVITPEQFQLLWKFGGWLSDDVSVYLNYEYPDLSWLAKYSQHPRLRLEDWQEICDFIYGKLNQDPVPSLLHDRLKKMGIIDSDWKEDGNRASPSKPFNHAEKIGRNDPCPCGSGKKYKKCCER